MPDADEKCDMLKGWMLDMIQANQLLRFLPKKTFSAGFKFKQK